MSGILQPASGLLPGFMVIHGNRPELLRELFVHWSRQHPIGPLEDEVILVQSNGMAQWLRLALAANVAGVSDVVGGGGCGIAAALDTPLPAHFAWHAYRTLLGREAVPETSPFDKQPLTWRLMRLLPELLDDPAYAPLAGFLAEDEALRKRYRSHKNWRICSISIRFIVPIGLNSGRAASMG